MCLADHVDIENVCTLEQPMTKLLLVMMTTTYLTIKKNQEVCSLLSGNKNVKEKCPRSIDIPGNKQPSLVLAPREDVTDFCFTLNLPEVSCLAI